MSGFGYNVLGFGANASSAAAGGASDDQFNRVSFLSHFDGANNGVNNAFDDGSTSNHTITANGNVTQGSFGPFARPDGEWGISYNDGYMRFPDSADWTLGDTFTIEAFIFPTKLLGYNTIMHQGAWYLSVLSNGAVQAYAFGSGQSDDSTSGVIALNTWSHVAYSVSSGTGTFYVNGVARGTTTGNDVTDGSGELYCGKQGVNYWPFYGVQSNYRVVKGTAVYTSNFTVPTSKLTAITNTVLLTGQSNRFVDNSASGHVAELGGTIPKVSAFGPFLTSSVYNAAVNGASAYLDGDGDYLQAANSADFDLGTGNFTWECQAYINDITRTQWFFSVFTTSSGQNAWGLRLESSGTLNAYFSGDGGESVTTIGVAAGSSGLNENAWHHIAVVKNGTGSNNIQIYVDGVSKVTGTFGAIHDTNLPFRVGRQGNDSYAQYFLGYISDVRIVKGTAVYTGNFTPPTAPLTAITNTKMLLNMADAQAIDSAAHNNITLYGTAKTSTAQKKFGTASLLLDGNSDYATFPENGANNIDGGTNWTVELFWRFNNKTSPQYQEIVTKGNAFQFYSNNGVLVLDLTGIGSAGGSTLDNDTWYHIAIVKNGTAHNLYLNGTSDISITSSSNLDTNGHPWYLGSLRTAESTYPSNGYMDEVRISKMARYTSNFTAPSEAFADKGQ